MRTCVILCFVFITTSISAQEVVSNLISNPILLDNQFTNNLDKLLISLPFFDDFSYNLSSIL